MRGQLKKKKIELKPLIHMMFSSDILIRNNCKGIELLQHLAKFFDTDFGAEAQSQLKSIHPIYSQSLKDEEQLEVPSSISLPLPHFFFIFY